MKIYVDRYAGNVQARTLCELYDYQPNGIEKKNDLAILCTRSVSLL